MELTETASILKVAAMEYGNAVEAKERLNSKRTADASALSEVGQTLCIELTETELCRAMRELPR